MTKTDIGIYRGLKEKFDPEVHIGFFITTDTGELLIGDQSLGQTISAWKINDGVLTLTLNTGKEIVVTFPEATDTTKGLLSAADKAQLLALQTNLDSKVDKVTGKSLLADSEIEKLAGLPNSTELTNSIATAKAAGDNAQSDLNAHKQNKSNPHEVTKAQVGLGNVTNDAQVKRSEMGVANGVATLDADGKVPASQLPSYVDDIIDVYATYSKSDTGVLSDVTLYLDAAHTQLVTGEAGKIYQNIADGEPQYQFRWTGTIFSQTGASSLILGEVTGTAYDGAKGKANADNIAKIKGTSLSHIKDAAPVTTAADKVSINYECYEGNQYGAAGTDHTADIPAATTAKAGVMSAADKTKLENLNSKLVVADEEDVTAVDGKIKFKDRDTTNGMGYNILRLPENGILTQDMINQANTIYEIRYNFDLNGATITIPENCTLKFEGGGLANGEIVLDNTTINSSDRKIFEEVTFSGTVFSQVFEITWFVDQYLNAFQEQEVSIDSSVQINKALSSGAKLFHFDLNNKYFYLKNPIVVNGDISIIGDLSTSNYPTVNRRSNSRKGCVYSNEIVTLFIYNFIPDRNNSGETNIGLKNQNSLIISGLTFYCRKTFTDLSAKDTPIVVINNKDTVTNTALWGLVFNCNIQALDCTISYSPDGIHTYNGYVPNYTALQINAVNGNITYTKLRGFYTNTFYGVVLNASDGKWITDTTLDADTICVKGIKSDVGTPYSIFGSHQPLPYYQNDNKEAYFETNWVNLYGFVWDRGVGDNTSGYRVRYVSGSQTTFSEYNTVTRYYDQNPDNISDRYYKNISNLPSHPNFLYGGYTSPSSKRIKEVSIKINNKDLYDSDLSIYNQYNIFPKQINAGAVGLSLGSNLSSLCFLRNTSGTDKELSIQIDIVLDTSGFHPKMFENLYYYSHFGNSTITISEADQVDGPYSTIKNSQISAQDSYYPIYYIFPTNRSKSILKISIICQFTANTSNSYTLPIVYFPNYLKFDEQHVYTITPNRPKIPDNFQSLGDVKIYDAYLKRVIQFNSDSRRWETLDGLLAIERSGSSSNRATQLGTDKRDIGFPYFDTTLNRPVYWNGTKWVDPAEDSIKWRTIE